MPKEVGRVDSENVELPVESSKWSNKGAVYNLSKKHKKIVTSEKSG